VVPAASEFDAPLSFLLLPALPARLFYCEDDGGTIQLNGSFSQDQASSYLCGFVQKWDDGGCAGQPRRGREAGWERGRETERESWTREGGREIERE